ncbi:MAG: division/cell wall cluster transcriptional repressor MraZ [Clostridiales bacterium]|nr:division/cell wall cluster transcriptional repressor MraZ [Clostridiales bacterium]
MFYGEYQHGLDAKNRAVIPSKFRAALGSRFMLTRGWDKCLVVYTMDKWGALAEKVSPLPTADEEVRWFTRAMFSKAAECEPDAQGRVLIPGKLREYAGIERDIVFVGAFERIEIWSLENWDKYNSEEQFDAEAVAAKMAELGV